MAQRTVMKAVTSHALFIDECLVLQVPEDLTCITKLAY